MIRGLEEQYIIEDRNLAPYAVHNAQTRGRRYPEPPHPLRTDFQRDRDRVLHSRAFRRLEYKTQVFLNGTGDHLRTRLTHTIEVAAISRTIARALSLNEDLAETIALAHDLGHTPFGHSGETALNELMEDHGGFDHNEQALRIVDLLEIKYPDFNGLNLTWEVRAGLVKHRQPGVTVLDDEILPARPPLESQIADLADDLTYYGHDVDDGIDAGLISEEMLDEVELWHLAAEKATSTGIKSGSERFRAFTVRCLIDMMVENAVENSNRNIQSRQLSEIRDVQSLDQNVIAFDDRFSKLTVELREFLFHNVYYHKAVKKANNNAVERMRKLFEKYIDSPELMGKLHTRHRIKEVGIYRATTDYIAGMTDRYALQQFRRCCR